MTDCTFPDRPGTKHVTVESVLERLGLTHGRVGHEPSGDIEAARKALGYSRINLSGGSYGCAVAYTYCLRCPQTDVETLLVWAVRGDEAEPTGEQARYFRRGQVVLLKDMGHMDVGSLQPQATHHLEKRLFLEGAADASLYQSITEQSRDFVPRIAHTWPSGMTDGLSIHCSLTNFWPNYFPSSFQKLLLFHALFRLPWFQIAFPCPLRLLLRRDRLRLTRS